MAISLEERQARRDRQAVALPSSGPTPLADIRRPSDSGHVAPSGGRVSRIGPAAGRDETALLHAVATAATANVIESVTVRVPGACASLLEVLVSSGFHIRELAVFLASQPFGRPELYLPSGPILY